MNIYTCEFLSQFLQMDLGIRLPGEARKLAWSLRNGHVLTDWLNHILRPSVRLKVCMSGLFLVLIFSRIYLPDNFL